MRVIGQHPNIIDTGDFFAWDDNKFVLPIEWVEGGRPLQTIFDEDEDRSIAWRDKADVIAKLCRALRHAHKRGVIHRDVRPMNVVIGPAGAPGAQVVKLVNFDLAFLEGAPQLSDPKGLKARLDPRYVAPEVWEDPAQASRRSDIYSLGIVFYQLITSDCPYQHVDELAGKAETPLDRERLLAELSTPGSEDFMDSPGDAADVIARMCAKDPAARYASMDEVLVDLSILAEVDTPPPSSTQRFSL
jgi:serine/threonine-protein kinase